MSGGAASLEVHERLLVLQAQARDAAAFRELVHRYERRLLYYVRRIIDDEHEALDVLQEIWLLVFRRLPTLAAAEAFRVWLYKLAHDVCISRLRRRRSFVDLPEESMTSAETEAWDELAALENAELVHATLQRLSPAHREVLTLRFLEDLDLEEIANITGCQVGTVKSRLHYAKHALRQQLEGSTNV